MSILQAPVKQTDAREVIAKFREVADRNPDVFTVEHERQRATKNRPERNWYALRHNGRSVAVLHTNENKVRWTPRLAEIVRSA